MYPFDFFLCSSASYELCLSWGLFVNPCILSKNKIHHKPYEDHKDPNYECGVLPRCCWTQLMLLHVPCVIYCLHSVHFPGNDIIKAAAGGNRISFDYFGQDQNNHRPLHTPAPHLPHTIYFLTFSFPPRTQTSAPLKSKEHSGPSLSLMNTTIPSQTLCGFQTLFAILHHRSTNGFEKPNGNVFVQKFKNLCSFFLCFDPSLSFSLIFELVHSFCIYKLLYFSHSFLFFLTIALLVKFLKPELYIFEHFSLKLNQLSSTQITKSPSSTLGWSHDNEYLLGELIISFFPGSFCAYLICALYSLTASERLCGHLREWWNIDGAAGVQPHGKSEYN
ncbi:hypothetical protein VP01_944g4 [Puccinia sorghi]|uniref:Uncharacterized protein n=1 Tax=Puccinia sorghi TaxID=27349 RepID=A0A0L6U8N7_9BASI|nr:hypothetical protein VP01_944g4 [Puccinia sorghi]